MDKPTANYGVCILGSTYNEHEVDYYGVLKEVLLLQYIGLSSPIPLFKCHWFDTSESSVRYHPNGLVEVKHTSRYAGNDPFVLAGQAQQVYYTNFPGNKRDRVDWWGVAKVKATGKIDIPHDPDRTDGDMNETLDTAFQEGETTAPEAVLPTFELFVDLGDVAVEEPEELTAKEIQDLEQRMLAVRNNEYDEETTDSEDEEDEFAEYETGSDDADYDPDDEDTDYSD